MQQPTHSPRDNGRYGERAMPVTHSRRAAINPPTRSNEYLYFYDDWVEAQFDNILERFPFLGATATGLSHLVRHVRMLAFRYYGAHSMLVHMIVFFCFLSTTIGLLIAFCMDAGLTAFTIPAHHHRWDLSTKASACKKAALYYFIFGSTVLLVSWLRPHFGSMSYARIRQICSKSFWKKSKRYGHHSPPEYHASSSSESELQPARRQGSAYSDSGLHNRSGTASGYSSSSSYHSPGPKPARLAVPGRIKKEHLSLLGLPSGNRSLDGE